MKKYDKQRLFEVMKKLDNTFRPHIINWKSLHDKLMLNTEIVKEGWKSVRKNSAATVDNLTHEFGTLTPDELQRLKDSGLISFGHFSNLQSSFPIITDERYFDFNTFKTKGTEILN
jgi:hypothetical protein